MGDSLREPITTRDALARVLADFLVWTEHPWHRADDVNTYLDFCTEYIAVRGLARVDPPPAVTVGYCDLCGQGFDRRPTHQLENWTGNNYCWCADCVRQQAVVRAGLGAERYRELWRQQEEEAHAHD